MTDKQILKLEQIDEMFFRKLFSLAKSAPREGMYIECGKMPLKFVTWIRQIMFYWHILQKDENELLHKFLTAQKITNSSKDWFHQVRKNMDKINLNLTDEQITNISKEGLKRIVKVKVETFALNYLNQIKQSHTKTKQLTLKQFSPSEYLMSADLNIEQVQTL